MNFAHASPLKGTPIVETRRHSPTAAADAHARLKEQRSAAAPVNSAWHRIATALPVSQPGEPAELEAERVADAAMRGGPPAQCVRTLRDEAGEFRRAGGSSTGPLAGAVDDAGPGRPLDQNTRNFFEARFGEAFGDVRVHDDAQAVAAARSVDAIAFTRGRDIVFGADEYAPPKPAGQHVLAHELAHVVQQRAGRLAPGATLARQPWGSEKTTAPPAKNQSPGDVFRGQLKDEVALFANAGAILDWIVSTRAGASGAPVESFLTSQLFADAGTMKKIRPLPATDAELLPALQMLAYYEVIKAKGPGEWSIALAPLSPGQTQPDVNRSRFDQNRQDIAAFQKSFETRFDTKGHPIRQIAQQELLEDSLSGGAPSEFAAQTEAETRLEAVTAELGEFVALRKKGKPVFHVTTDSPERANTGGRTMVLLPIARQKTPISVDDAEFDHIEPVSTGTSPEVEARRKDIAKRSGVAERNVYNAQGFHRFATEMVWFLHELAKGSGIKFQAGTYPQHGKFGEYAADMFPVIAENAARFYKVDRAEQFVDDINKVAEAGHPYWGKFAWQIVYNDTVLQKTINDKYGARMSSAPHHGPAPDKLHMHLDIRPLHVVGDRDTGFHIDSSGRVSLY